MDQYLSHDQPSPHYQLQGAQTSARTVVGPYADPFAVEPEFQATPLAQPRVLWVVLGLAALVLLGGLVFYNLTSWPVTWFDEGSHLHVPKTLVTDGVYADKSSDGYRYFGPTLGVGPTVMLPIALAFGVSDIGLFQARMVMAIYLVLALIAFYALARQLAGVRFAIIAVALLVSMRGATTLEYGRQVLGEVPALFFMAAGLALWFGGKGRDSWLRLMGAGLLLGLSIVTKSQNLLVIAPALLIGWVANLIWYRAVPQRFFLVTGFVTALVVALWQGYMALYLGPATWQENLALLQAASAGAAFVFSQELMLRSLGELFNLRIFLGMLPLFLGYGVLLGLPRSRGGVMWGVIVLMVAANLIWYVFASVGWIRYAFPGLALTTLFAARLFDDIFGAVRWEWREIWGDMWQGATPAFPVNLALVAGPVLALLIAAPLALTVRDIATPPANSADAMAAWMDKNVPTDAVVETWEPEMGFLTNHNYHYPPSGLLDKSVGYIWRDGPPPAEEYRFVQDERPPYVLVGAFSRWVEMYDAALAEAGYEVVHSEGNYALYEPVAAASAPAEGLAPVGAPAPVAAPAAAPAAAPIATLEPAPTATSAPAAVKTPAASANPKPQLPK